jgi:hypothetical protein
MEITAEGDVEVNIEDPVDWDDLREFQGCLLVVQHRYG